MEEWLRIGEVARRTGLTVRTLRHYDDLGLLVPSGRSGGDYRLYSADDLRRLLAIQHLKSLGLALPEIAAALDDPAFDAADALARHIAVVEERLAAERALLARLRGLVGVADAGWGDVVDAIALTERLCHPEAHVRFRAALDAPASAPLATLLAQLRTEPEPGVRENLTWAIVRHPDALAAVVPQLADRDAGVRLRMTHVLSKLADPAAVPALVPRLADADAAVRAKAAFALGQVGGPDALLALVGALGSDDPLLADAVVSALDRFGSRAVPLLEAALAGGGPAVREQAAEALGFVADPAATDALAAALDDPEGSVRFAALTALGALGTPEARAAAGQRADDADPHTRLLARRIAGS
ncbi:HEAT repeat domain-containing protein [Propioniciclava soli]|uniref:HEAT repeat domain-containing protein n=1 Tax=Propioniciclava soli TaxID=2775081 RepID=A0ABZ3C6I4_9ACTN